MATLTIRNVDDVVKQRLRVQAAEHGRSMEEELRRILKEAVEKNSAPEEKLGTRMSELFAEIGGVELELPERTAGREPPDFSSPDFDR